MAYVYASPRQGCFDLQDSGNRTILTPVGRKNYLTSVAWPQLYTNHALGDTMLTTQALCAFDGACKPGHMIRTRLAKKAQHCVQQNRLLEPLVLCSRSFALGAGA